jgi:hypothetical protein
MRSRWCIISPNLTRSRVIRTTAGWACGHAPVPRRARSSGGKANSDGDTGAWPACTAEAGAGRFFGGCSAADARSSPAYLPTTSASRIMILLTPSTMMCWLLFTWRMSLGMSALLSCDATNLVPKPAPRVVTPSASVPSSFFEPSASFTRSSVTCKDTRITCLQCTMVHCRAHCGHALNCSCMQWGPAEC